MDRAVGKDEAVTRSVCVVTRAASAAVLIIACGSGRVDPFEERHYVAPNAAEQCDAVDKDESKSFVPPALSTVSVTAATTNAGEFAVDWAAYPLPYADAKVWSIWGKGLVTSRGLYLSAVGDGDSPDDGTGHDGNSFVYEYDPSTRVLRAVGDALTAFGMHVPGENGYAKIQGQMGEGPCGLIYVHTYWASPTSVVYGGGYEGDLLLRYNPWTRHLESLGVKIPRMGVPSMTLYRPLGLIYAEANTPTDPKDVVFWAYDIATDSVIFESPRRQRNDRNVAVDRDGSAYYTGLGADLYRYDPVSNSETPLGATFEGGGWLRASTRVATDGTILMVTTEPDEAYRFDPKRGTLTRIATLTRPIADIDLDPTERVAYFVPVGLDGLPGFELYELNRSTGALRQLIDLGAAIEAAGGSRPRGSYSINVSDNGRTIYVAANSGDPDGFGVPMFIAVKMPDSALP